jgi:hypothetical protein
MRIDLKSLLEADMVVSCERKTVIQRGRYFKELGISMDAVEPKKRIYLTKESLSCLYTMPPLRL